MMALRTSYLFFACLFAVQVTSKTLAPFLNKTSPVLGTNLTTGNVTGRALDRAPCTSLLSSSSTCNECNYDFGTGHVPWAISIPTNTLLVLIDNSTNITSTSTIQDQLSTFETDVSIALTGYDNKLTAQLGEKVHLTYPTPYNIIHSLVKSITFLQHTTVLSGTSASSSSLCRTTEISYTNVFAVPLVDGQMANGSALSEYESYLSTVWNNCTSLLGVDFEPRIPLSASVLVPASALAPASALTITSTSFTSLARSIVANRPSSVEEETLISGGGPRILAKTSALTPASALTITSTLFTSLARSTITNRPSSVEVETVRILAETSALTPASALTTTSTSFTSLARSIAASPSPSVEEETLTSSGGDQNAPAFILAKTSALIPASALTTTSTSFTSLARSIAANPSPSVEEETLTSSGGDQNAPAFILAKTSALTPALALTTTSTSFTSLARSIAASPSPSVEEETLTSSGGDQNAPARILVKTSALTPDSALTTTSTSFTSLARSISANRSPSEKTQNPLALTTTPVYSQNDVGAPPTEIASAKPVTDQVSRSVSNTPSPAALTPTPFPEPLSDGLKQLSIEYTANAPGNLEPNSPSPTPVLLGFQGSNTPELDSPINSALTLASPQRSSLPRLTLDSSIITANSLSQFVIDGQTLRPGGPEITVSGTPLALAPSGSITVALIASATPLPPLTLDGTTILPNSASEYLIGSQTLIPGAPAITISGTRISLAPSAYAVVVGSKTFPIMSGPTTTTSFPLITIGNSVITPNAASKYIIAGQTLAPGDPAITISGTRISVLPQATGVIVGASTERLSRPTLVGVGATTPASLNGSASATGPAALQGGVTRVYGRRWISAILIVGMGLWGWS